MSVLLTVVVGVVWWGAVVQGALCPGRGLADCPAQQSNTSGGGKTSRDYCYTARIRSTVLQGLPFGGVPTVLALDFMCFLVLLFVFSILRKVAWDYGRLALVTDADRISDTAVWMNRNSMSSYCITLLLLFQPI
uniref:Transmembrane protein 63B n=1 Tax=Oncorhynchus tshawytscha TaxID=74940 RepID=A0AAZ3P695_ONCTS